MIPEALAALAVALELHQTEISISQGATFTRIRYETGHVRAVTRLGAFPTDAEMLGAVPVPIGSLTGPGVPELLAAIARRVWVRCSCRGWAGVDAGVES